MATAESRTRPFGRALALDLEGDVSAALLGLAAVAPLAAVDGGWSPTSWGWSSLAFAGVAVVALLLRTSVAVGRLETALLAALSAFAVWTLLSAAWSDDAGSSVLSFARLLVYLTALAVAFAVVRQRTYPALLGGVWAASTLVCGYALATRLYPDRFDTNIGFAGNRLAAPVGYWNGLGLLAAVGLLLAVGFAVSARSRALRAVAGATLVPLSLSLYFTFSRGAWLVLVLGLVVAFALDPRRLRLAAGVLALAPWVVLAVAQAAGATALTTLPIVTTRAAGAGAHLAHLSLLFALGAAVFAVALGEAGRRIDVPRNARRGFAAALAVAALAAVVVGLSRYGGPVDAARTAWHSFVTRPPATNDLNARLFSLTGNGRIELWRVALDTWRANPVLGSGAGTYQREWLANRPEPSQVVNAHNLYAETLAETGPAGLALLLAALALPLLAAFRARRLPLVSAAAAAYVAFLAHVFFDWDWQLPGVALAPVLAGAALLAAAREDRLDLPWQRYGGAAALLVVALVAGFMLVGNRAAGAAVSAAEQDDWPQAVAQARRAGAWQPWSARPWQILGETQLQEGQLAAARRSFRKGLEKAPDSWQLWLDLALASDSPAARRAAALRASALNPLSVEIDQVRPALGLPKRRP